MNSSCAPKCPQAQEDPGAVVLLLLHASEHAFFVPEGWANQVASNVTEPQLMLLGV